MNGGSLEHLGDTLPDIVSPEAMHENVEFYYVSAHGKTNLSEYYVVPENTFVFYLGFSGFVKISGVADNPDLDRMLFPGGYNGNPRVSLYWKELYQNFFTGDKETYKLYPAASIYVPGDLVPQTSLSFNSDTKDFWKKGIFTLPIREDLLETFTRANVDTIVTEFIKMDADGLIPGELFGQAIFKSGKEAEWRAKKETINHINENDEEDLGNLSDWFENPSAFQDFSNKHLQSDEDNLVGKYNIPLVKGRTTMSTMFSKIVSDKTYRFFIVTSCRGPYNVTKEDKIYFKSLKDRAQYMYPNPTDLPAEVKPQYRIARRASFAAKEFEEDCGLSTEPAMNLIRIQSIVKQMLEAQVFEKYLDTHKEDEQIASLLRAIQGLHYASSIHVSALARLLDVTTRKYAFVDDETVDIQQKEAFLELLGALQSAFGFFIYGLHQDKSINAEYALKTAGEWLLAHSFKPSQSNAYVAPQNVVANQRAYVNQDKFKQFEAYNVRYRVNANASDVTRVGAIEVRMQTLSNRLKALKTRANNIRDDLRNIKAEYDEMRDDITYVESLVPIYENSYRPAAEKLVDRIYTIVESYEEFPLEYQKLLAKKGGRRKTRKQRSTRRRNTRRSS